MNNSLHLNNKISGSATVLLILMLSLLMGAISISLFTGQLVNKKIEYQNVSDLGMKTVAGHGAQGLNLVASNNLAIAASVHMAGLVPVMAHYISPFYGMVKYNLLKIGLHDLEMAGEITTGGRYRGKLNLIQNELWDKLAILPHIYMGTAVGLTSFNQFLSEHWLVFGHSYYYESLQLNSPHSLGLNWQRRSAEGPAPVFNYRFEGLAKMDAKSTFCSSIRASEVLDETSRDNLFTWFSGIFQSVLDNEKASKIGKVTDILDRLTNAVTKVMMLKLGYVDCGYGVKGPFADFVNSFSSNNVLENIAMDFSNGSVKDAFRDMAGRIEQLCEARYPKRKKLLLGEWRESDIKCALVYGGTEALRKGGMIGGSFVLEPKDVIIFDFIRTMISGEFDQTTCENNSHHITAKLKDRSTFCLNLHAIDPLCVFEKELLQIKDGIKYLGEGGKETAKVMEVWLEGDEASVYGIPTCQAYKQLFEDEKQDFDGFQIVDYSQQVYHFVKSGGGVEANARDSLAFTYIDDEQAFAESRRFYGLLATAEGWTYDRADQEAIVEEQCSESIDINTLTLDDGTVLCKYNQFVHAFNNMNINQMLSADADSDDLKIDIFSQVHTRNLNGYLANSEGNGLLLRQAIFNQSNSRIHFESLPDEDIQDSMFWPNWKGQLTTEF